MIPHDFLPPFGNVGCVIMASGMGKRFGGNKLMADFGGMPLISRILDATEGIFARRVVVTRHEDVVRLCEGRGIPAILHQLPHRNDTVRLGLETMMHTERCMFCPSDQPLLRRETVAALAMASAEAADFIHRPMVNGTEGAPVVFPARLYDELLTLPEGKGGGYVIAKHRDSVRYLPINDPFELMDVDTAEDLEDLLRRFRNRT